MERAAGNAALTRAQPPVIWLAGAAIIGVALLLIADPNATDSWLPPCPFHALTDLYCPGCGTTRALHALLHGDWLLALSMNPLATLALPLLPLLYWQQQRPRPWLGPLADARWWLPLVLLFAVLRNLPWEPFSWLAPG